MCWTGFGSMTGGWWLMPLFGLLFMVIFLYAISRIFGGSCCNRQPPEQYDDTDELRQEISKLRAEIATLRGNCSQGTESSRDQPDLRMN